MGILILKGPQENRFELPGGHIKALDNEVEDPRKKLNKQLMPSLKELSFQWEIGELVGIFYRPSHQRYIFPYIPPHVSKTKEILKIYIVQLPEKCVLSTPENQTIVAVPIFDLFDNSIQWGTLLANIPVILSRLNLVSVS